MGHNKDMKILNVYLMAHRPNTAHPLFLEIDMYWNTAVPIHLLMISGYFQVTAARLNHPQSQKYLLDGPFFFFN